MTAEDNDDLVLKEKIYQSKFNAAAAAYRGTFKGQPAVVKQRADSMEREVRVLKTLDDAVFPKLLHYGKSGNVYQLVLEEIPGQTLASYIDVDYEIHSRVLNRAESIEIIQKLASGLIALREAGYYYRDMNMKHILLEGNAGELRVTLIDHEADVKIKPDKTAIVDSRTGTWETISPEEFDVGNIMTEVSTTYSLGALLFQLTHGEAAYRLATDPPEGMTSRAMAHELHKAPVDKSRFNVMKPILAKALDPDPARRYQTLEDFIEAIVQ